MGFFEVVHIIELTSAEAISQFPPLWNLKMASECLSHKLFEMNRRLGKLEKDKWNEYLTMHFFSSCRVSPRTTLTWLCKNSLKNNSRKKRWVGDLLLTACTLSGELSLREQCAKRGITFCLSVDAVAKQREIESEKKLLQQLDANPTVIEFRKKRLTKIATF